MIPLHDDNPTRIQPVITILIIIICVLVFLWQVSQPSQAGQAIVFAFGVIPAVLTGKAALPPELAVIPPELTIFTSMFMHGGWMHLIGNMLYLWIFGNNVEDSMGHGRFLVFYLLCGVFAALAQTLTDPSSEIPMVGASGAISGVLGAYLLLYPHARVLVAVPVGFSLWTGYLPAGLVLGLWFVFQLLSSALADSGQGGVAFMAHIGGFIAGMALIPLFKSPQVRFLNPPRPPGGSPT